MAAYGADLYNDGGIALLEAGTGVGKSFAYLVPALVWARENGERTIVSTNTINLQEQLVGKDLPILARALGTGDHTPSFALLKGWHNYLCLARLEQARAGLQTLFDEREAAELESLGRWAAKTSDGSLADLADEPGAEAGDAATHLGAQVSMVGVNRLLSRLERSGRGLLPTLEILLRGRDDLLSAASRDLVEQGLRDALNAARRAAEEVFAQLGRRLDREQGAPSVLRLGDEFAGDAIWAEGLGVSLDNLLVGFGRLRDGVETVADRLALDDPSERRAQLVGELRGVVRRLDASATGLTAALRPAPGAAAAVRWLERRGKKIPNVSVAAVPLDLARLLKENLFDRVETVILTSATLAAGGEFGYLEERLGLDLPPSRVAVREVLPSPFDFPSQCLFAIPTDLPEPRDDEEGHDAAVARVLLELAHASDGGMFVLFTSHGALRRTATAVRGEIGGRWPLLVQGEGQRDLLLRPLPAAGTAHPPRPHSFWEGGDGPGRALRVLILAKLPFKGPSEPPTAARPERPEAKGLNGFSHYLVPNAALKLKQGFGRLIRSKTDVGAVILLDRRVVTKRYGPLVLEGLPPAERVIGRWEDVRDACEEFFARHGIGQPHTQELS